MPNLDDFLTAQTRVKPSQIMEFHTDVKHVAWNDVAGFVELKETLLKQIVWPITHPETFKKLGLTAPAGILSANLYIFSFSSSLPLSSLLFVHQEFCCTEAQAVVRRTSH